MSEQKTQQEETIHMNVKINHVNKSKEFVHIHIEFYYTNIIYVLKYIYVHNVYKDSSLCICGETQRVHPNILTLECIKDNNKIILDDVFRILKYVNPEEIFKSLIKNGQSLLKIHKIYDEVTIQRFLKAEIV